MWNPRPLHSSLSQPRHSPTLNSNLSLAAPQSEVAGGAKKGKGQKSEATRPSSVFAITTVPPVINEYTGFIPVRVSRSPRRRILRQRLRFSDPAIVGRV